MCGTYLTGPIFWLCCCHPIKCSRTPQLIEGFGYTDMDSNKSTIGTERATKPPSEPKRDNTHDMPKNSAPTLQQLKRTKPGTEVARRDANTPNKETITSRESTPSPQKSTTHGPKHGHQKNNSDSSNTSSMFVSVPVSDRGDESDRDRIAQPHQPSATERKNDMNGIGEGVSPRTPPRRRT